MKTELIALQPKLVEAQKETADMMVVITSETEEANKVKTVVEGEEAIANTKAAEVKEIKDDCEADLAEAIPVLNSAIAALDTLQKKDIDEVKSMKKQTIVGGRQRDAREVKVMEQKLPEATGPTPERRSS